MDNIEKLSEAAKVIREAAFSIENARLDQLNGIKHTVRQTLNAMLLLETKAFQEVERAANQRRAELQQEAVDVRNTAISKVEVASEETTPVPAKKAKKAKKSGK